MRNKIGQIQDLAFDLKLFAPRVSQGYEIDRTTIYILTFGELSNRKTMIFPHRLSLEEIETRIQQEVGHLPLVSVSRKSCSRTTSIKL